MNRQTQRSPQRPGSSPAANLTCHADRLAQTASHTSTFRVLKIKSQPVMTRRRRAFCAHEEVRKLYRKKIKSSLCLHTRLKLAEALSTTPMSIVQRLTYLDLATWHGTHQTGMPLVRGELPEHSGSDHTSTPCTLAITPVQSEGCRASRATANRLRPPSTIGCSALPC